MNPEWNEELTLSITDPNLPIKLTVYDYDTFSPDDPMGDAEFDIKAYTEALKIDNFQELPEGTVIMNIQPSRSNCLAEESKIIWSQKQVTQNMILRLRNVECGEVELTLNWINVPGAKGLKF